MSVHRFTNTNEAWLELRKKYITATEAPILLGLDSYTTANQLVKNKLIAGKIDSPYLRSGKILEAAVLSALGIDAGKSIGLIGTEIHVDEEHRMSSTPDAVENQELVLVECKTTSWEHVRDKWLQGEPPLKYVAQVMAQMATTNYIGGSYADYAYLAVLAVDRYPHLVLAYYKVSRSDRLITLMRSQVAEFWKHLEAGTPMRVPATVRNEAAELCRSSIEFVNAYGHETLRHQTHEALGRPLKVEDIFN